MSEFKEALNAYDKAKDYFDINFWLYAYKCKFIKALRIADKLMQEPSKELEVNGNSTAKLKAINKAFPDGWDVRDLVRCETFFKTMRDQMLK